MSDRVSVEWKRDYYMILGGLAGLADFLLHAFFPDLIRQYVSQGGSMGNIVIFAGGLVRSSLSFPNV